MSVLDDMTKGITERKAAKAGPKLTPVGTETSPTKPSQKPGVPDVPEVFLTNEAIIDIAKDLRSKAATLLEVADGLDVLTESSSMAVPDAKNEAALAAKQAEREADEKAKFAADFAAKQEAAQAAAFTSLDAGDDDEPAATEAPADGGWTCPTHGATNVKQLTSRKGRVYAACQVGGCDRFEK